MTIFVPMGSDVKDAAERLREWVLEKCPHCGSEQLRVHDHWVRVVPVKNGAGADVEMLQKRYVCRRCGRRIIPVPDCMVPDGRYASAVRDYAIEEYISGRPTYQGLAEAIGCSKSTCWRWQHDLTRRAEPWVQTCREQVAAAGEPVGPLELPEGKRALWRRRRIRAPGMLEGLLLGEALMGWVKRLRGAWRQRTEVLPESFWSVCCHVLTPLVPSHPTERHARPIPATMARGGTGHGGGGGLGAAAGGAEAVRDDRAAGGGGGAAGGPDGPVAGAGGRARRDGADAAAALPALPAGGELGGADAAGAAGGCRKPAGDAGCGAGRGGATAAGAAGAQHPDPDPAVGGTVPGTEGAHRASDAGPAPAPVGADPAAAAGSGAGAAALPEPAPQRPVARGFQLPGPAVAERQRTEPDGDPGDPGPCHPAPDALCGAPGAGRASGGAGAAGGDRGLRVAGEVLHRQRLRTGQPLSARSLGRVGHPARGVHRGRTGGPRSDRALLQDLRGELPARDGRQGHGADAGRTQPLPFGLGPRGLRAQPARRSGGPDPAAGRTGPRYAGPSRCISLEPSCCARSAAWTRPP